MSNKKTIERMVPLMINQRNLGLHYLVISHEREKERILTTTNKIRGHL
jgi:hypothetical protein